jgi:hypothetical protein
MLLEALQHVGVCTDGYSTANHASELHEFVSHHQRRRMHNSCQYMTDRTTTPSQGKIVEDIFIACAFTKYLKSHI